MSARRLIAAVYVKDPETHEDLILLPGGSPVPEIAALVTHPDAWGAPCEEEAGQEPVSSGETAPTSVGARPDQESGEAGGSSTKKSPSRRTRSSSA
ncbi:hypothetical protein [Streptomyces bluensis]|uniref:hypothetical protein n=1 Tax=Streptomyces bluensis TaxID=33897 RepID=UPI0033339FA2